MPALAIEAKDLSKKAPRSPRTRILGYAILARTLDKCRASLAGTNGEYHFNCALDNMLFGFKAIDAEAFKACVQEGASDEETAHWMDQNGAAKTRAEINEWSNSIASATLFNHPEKGEWFIAECQRLGLDPSQASLFDYLEAEDAASFQR